MANQDIPVSGLQNTNSITTEDLALVTVVDELSATGYTSKHITEGNRARQYLGNFTWQDLQTEAKDIFGAINEAATTGGSDEFIIHMTDTTVTETATDIIDAFDNGSEIWLESQMTGEALKTRLPLLAYISDSNSLVLRFSGITYSNNRYRYCDVQMTRNPEQILGKQAVNVTFAVIDDATTSASSVWSSQKTASELASKAEIDDTAIDTETTWSSSRIVSLLPTESASGAVANFETPLTLPLVSHNVTIEPVQAGTGDPSPSNPRAISGFTGMSIISAGVNLWDEQWEVGVYNTTTGQKQDANNRIRSKGYIKVSPNSLVYVKTSETIRLFWYDKNFAYIDTYAYSNEVFVVPANAYYITFQTATAYGTTYKSDISINYPATDTDYHAYTGQTYTRTFLDSNDDPVTVYGGSENLKTGEGDINRGSVSLSDLDFSAYSSPSNHVFRVDTAVDLVNLKYPSSSSIATNAICEAFTAMSYDTISSSSNGKFAITGDSARPRRLVFVATDCSTVEEFLTTYGSTKLIYELATPQTFHCDPLTLDTLKGVNNIWADTGDTAVEYKQDIQTYIDSRLSSGTRSLSLAKAPVETKEETKQEEQEGDEDVNR